MNESKFKIGQKVRCVNEKQFREVYSITYDGSEYFYTLIDRFGCTVDRTAETVLRGANE